MQFKEKMVFIWIKFLTRQLNLSLLLNLSGLGDSRSLLGRRASRRRMNGHPRRFNRRLLFPCTLLHCRRLGHSAFNSLRFRRRLFFSLLRRRCGSRSSLLRSACFLCGLNKRTFILIINAKMLTSPAADVALVRAFFLAGAA